MLASTNMIRACALSAWGCAAWLGQGPRQRPRPITAAFAVAVAVNVRTLVPVFRVFVGVVVAVVGPPGDDVGVVVVVVVVVGGGGGGCRGGQATQSRHAVAPFPS